MTKIFFFSFSLLLVSGLAAQMADVYIIRRTGFLGCLKGFPVLHNGEAVCKLNERRYTKLSLAAGEHELAIKATGKKLRKKTPILHLSVQAGETYYLGMEFFSIWHNRIRLKELSATEGSYYLEAQKFKADPSCLE